MRGGVLADEPLAAELRHAGGLAGHVVGRGRALVLALGLALIFDTLLDRGGLGLGALRLLALALRLRLDALLLEDGEALFGAIFYRYGCVPAKCKNCGNGILVKTKGKRREFCSPSCRTRYSNRKAGP